MQAKDPTSSFVLAQPGLSPEGLSRVDDEPVEVGIDAVAQRLHTATALWRLA